ncbi:MAG TPA: YfhO family protein [Thermoanaerobaculia bacterium]|nr:YfhO family protein [Thermoanaerobaculia bacterium]
MTLWPFLLYLLAATAIAAGAMRLRLGLRRRDAAVLILAPLVFVGPALISGGTLFPVDRAYRVQPFDAHRELLGDRPASPAIFHDPFAMIAPWRAAVRHAYAMGEWPLWNPWCRAGEPLAGMAQSAPYAPVNLLALLVPLEDEAALVGGLHLAIAGLGGFLAFATFGLSRRAALVGAVAWSTSGFLLFWNLWPVTPTLAFFPWVLFSAVLLAREPSRGNAALLGLTLTLILLTGHSESVAHAVLVAAACAAFAMPWRQLRPPFRTSPALRSIGFALGAGIVAAALSAFFLLPHLEAIDQTLELVVRRGAADKAFHARPYGESAALLRAEFVPYAWGIFNDEVGRHPDYGFSLYAPGRAFSGGLIVALAVAGLAGPRRRIAAAGAALYLFGVLAGIGFRPLHVLLARLPIFDLALNDRLAFVGAFGLAMLAAAAVDAWDSSEPRRRATPWITAGAALALGLLAALFWQDAAPLGLDATAYLERTAWLVVPALGAAALLAFARPRDWAVALLLVAHLAERRAETGYLFVPQERKAFFPAVAPLDAVPETSEPQRVLALDVAMPPDTFTHYRFEDPRGDNAMTLRRLGQFRNYRNDPQDPSWTFLRFNRLDDPVVDFLNARYVLVPRPKTAPYWYRQIAEGRSLVLYENRHALPRAFLPRRVVVGSDPVPLMARTAVNQTFLQLATIEPIGQEVATRERRNARGRLVTKRQGLGFEIEADLQAAGWIVVSETHWPGWHATIDGRELPLAYANHAFVGIYAPAGRNRIDLRYRPRSFVWGLRISAGTALLLLGFTVIAWRTGRRPAHPGIARPATPGHFETAPSVETLVNPPRKEPL